MLSFFATAVALATTTLPEVTPGPNTKVYGYQAYWDDDLMTVPWDDLSHIALFAASSDANGVLSDTDRWDEAALAVQLAEPYGVRVHLCVTNFSTSSLELFLGDEAAQDLLIEDLVQWLGSTGAHGVNIDFEGMPSSRRSEMVTFTRNLEAAVGEVTLATPAVDWSDAWDYAALTEHADLFIMGYALHWSGSSISGPTDPLYGGDGTPWSVYSLDWSAKDYRDNGANLDRVILGLALYGIRFPVAENVVPTENMGTGTSVFMADGIQGAETHGALYEASSASPYYFDGSDQVWYPTVDSIMTRVDYVASEGLGGFGFWALHYDDDDPELWGAIHAATTEPQDPDEPGDEGFAADVGQPFLAYVGDTVGLDGTASTGPSGVDLRFLWEQVSGPEVTLSSPTSPLPTFEVEAPGNHVFQLRVGDGVAWSDPVNAFVIVVDREAGQRHGGPNCGCASTRGGSWIVLLASLLCLRRRTDRGQ
jgi:spore germination protein YaaH